jgi:hypothetical protein
MANKVAMATRRDGYRALRAWASSGVQSSLKQSGLNCDEGIISSAACALGSHLISTGLPAKQVNDRAIILFFLY